LADETLIKFGILGVGWLLGILSPSIVESIRRARDVRPMQESLADELHEIRYATACISSIFRSHLGTADQDFRQWLKGVADSYHGVEPIENFRKAATYLALLDGAEAEAVRAYEAKPDGALNVKELKLPALDARVPSLWMFPKRSQSELLRLLADVAIYNQDVEHAKDYQKLSFQLEGINHHLAIENLKGVYAHLGTVAQRISDRAGKCEVGLRKGQWPL
jgi:hypothetical protein